MEMNGRKRKLQPRRRQHREREVADVGDDDIESFDEDEREAPHEDDCEAIVYDDCDELENIENGVTLEEERDVVLEDHFGEIEREETDEESGDDIWNDNVIPADEIIALGKTFGSATEFKQVLLRYSLKTQFDIKLFLSTQKKLGAVCSDKDNKDVSCPWIVYCSYEKSKHKLQIKAYVNEHVCIRSGYSKMLKSSSIAQLFEERLRVNPKITAKDMVDEIKQNYNLIVTDDQCRKAKTKITRERRASHENHFSRVWDYQAEIFSTNSGTTMEIETIPGPNPGSKQRFDRLDAQRKSWMSTCRPIIGLDGAFLKWDVKGQLIAAVGRDGDNRIFPIAWGVVEIENNNNWYWFVNHLKDDLRLDDGRNITIISDKQKGLVKAVHNVLPEAEHRMCARHILGNWKRNSHDLELERLFWKIARSYTKGDYLDNMEALKKYNQVAYDSLQKTNPPTWSRAFFKVGSFCNDNLNNLNESFNRTIREARRKPLLELLEDIRRQCMVRTAKRYVIASKLKTRFTRSAHKEIESAKDKSKDCKIHMARGDVYEVNLHGVAYSVNMNLKTCGCGKWQLNGIPCNHAACVIMGRKLRFDDYVSEYYTTRKWEETYKRGIQPVQGMKLWPRLNRLPVLPPPNRLGNRGRPSYYDRKKGLNESASSSKKNKLSREKRIMTCSNCREEEHNKLTCTRPSVEAEAKRPRGRPKKNQVPLQEICQIATAQIVAN